MRYFNIDERPAFTRFGEFKFDQVDDGYILQLDVDHFSANIIKLKERRNGIMIKTIVKAKEGFEELYDKVVEMKENHETDKNEAIKVAIAEVEAKFAEKADEIDKVLAELSTTEEVEVEDEVVEDVQVEQTEQVEEIPITTADTLY